MSLILSNSVPSPSQTLLFMEYSEVFVYSKQKINQKFKRKNTLCPSPEELTAHTIPSISLQYLFLYLLLQIWIKEYEIWFSLPIPFNFIGSLSSVTGRPLLSMSTQSHHPSRTHSPLPWVLSLFCSPHHLFFLPSVIYLFHS